jgi:hypothetical protein
MGESRNVCALTAAERHALVCLRHGPQSLPGLAETLGLTLEQTLNVLQRLSRHVGIVPFIRAHTLRYRLAE